MLGSPLPVTSHLLESSNGGSAGDGPTPDAWLLEKSREELSELLSKAEGIIKSRGERMSLVSSFYFYVSGAFPSASEAYCLLSIFPIHFP